MSIPIDPNKWQMTSHVTPKAFKEYAKKKGLNTKLESKNAIFSWAKSYTEEWLTLQNIKSYHVLNYKVFKLSDCGVNTRMGMGAPAAGVILEDFIEMGLENLVCIGIAGALDPKLKAGDVILCGEALRDEGTSYHYLPPEEKIISADVQLLGCIEALLKNNSIDYKIGKTWTTDAPYRETKNEIVKYKDQGIHTVDMEASALFSIAKVRKIRAVSIFIVSDVLNVEEWQPHFHHKIVKQKYQELIQVLVKNFGGGS